MSELRNITILTKINAKETFLNPSYYIAMTISTLLGYLPIRSFIQSIGPQGFNPSQTPLFANITQALEQLFSTIMVDKLFAEGPFLFAAYCAVVPMLLYILISSIITYHQYKDQGVLELLRYGPLKSRSYLFSLFLINLIALAIYCIYLIVVFYLVSRFNNLLLGPAFVGSMITLFLVSFLLCAYTLLSAVSTDSSIGSISLLLAILIIFLSVQLVTYSIVAEQVSTIASFVSLAVQWISPFFYMAMIQTGFELSSWIHILGGATCFFGLTVIIGFISIWIQAQKESKS
ncbi:hypothetical protein [Pleomorphochaeta sp. DL1XJH-081]|uniref:hypothetical protein n=1 Tax=Pleomorphochaeta sp. DL1XJH-081 TaxID=3409690 RepID=UPI003BB5B4C7